jgi:hypothetical protein
VLLVEQMRLSHFALDLFINMLIKDAQKEFLQKKEKPVNQMITGF